MLAKLLLAAILAISLAFAQGRGGGGGGRGGRGGGDDMGGGMPRMAARQTRGEQLRDKLGLNKEQQEEAQKILIAASQRRRTHPREDGERPRADRRSASSKARATRKSRKRWPRMLPPRPR